MNFGQAIEAAKEGKKIQRQGMCELDTAEQADKFIQQYKTVLEAYRASKEVV